MANNRVNEANLSGFVSVLFTSAWCHSETDFAAETRVGATCGSRCVTERETMRALAKTAAPALWAAHGAGRRASPKWRAAGRPSGMHTLQSQEHRMSAWQAPGRRPQLSGPQQLAHTRQLGAQRSSLHAHVSAIEPLSVDSPSTSAPAAPGPPGWDVKMLYDGECPLCMREVNMLRRRDEGKGRIAFVDISADDYRPDDNAGLTYEQVGCLSSKAACFPMFTVNPCIDRLLFTLS